MRFEGRILKQHLRGLCTKAAPVRGQETPPLSPPALPRTRAALPRLPPLPLVRVVGGLFPRVQHSADGRHVFCVQVEREERLVVPHVLCVACAQDHRRHHVVVQHPARCHVGYANPPVLVAHPLQLSQQRLEPAVPPSVSQHRGVLALAAGVQGDVLALDGEEFVRQEPARHDPVRQQPDAVGTEVGHHDLLWAAVQQAVLDLVGGDLRAGVHHLCHVLGVEVGQPHRLDLARRLEIRQEQRGVHVPLEAVVVPVHLHQVNGLHPEAAAGQVDALLHPLAGHVGLLAPHAAQLGEDLHVLPPHSPGLKGLADDHLAGTVPARLRPGVKSGDTRLVECFEVLHSGGPRCAVTGWVAAMPSPQLPAPLDHLRWYYP
mmetsp:Transcript_39353/g.63043  ORF Transcript_39353/g.63043 Transcript_39353/m.63043 type:complete len:374 (+) Transcript_39353:24-1145(+)